MPTEISPKIKTQLATQGCAIIGDIGGTKKRKYYTPTGREIYAIPAIRDWIKTKNGKIIDSGTRDANLDKGWLLEPPIKPKLECSGCHKWHDTPKEVNECIAKKVKFDEEWAAKARQENKKGGGIDELKKEVDGLKTDISDIKSLLNRLIEKGG